MTKSADPKKANNGVEEINLDELKNLDDLKIDVLKKEEIEKFDFEEPTASELILEEDLIEDE